MGDTKSGSVVLTGVLVAVLLLVVLLPARQPTRAAIHYVINTNDTGTGSLRWAIEQANGNNVPDSTTSISRAASCVPSRRPVGRSEHASRQMRTSPPISHACAFHPELQLWYNAIGR